MAEEPLRDAVARFRGNSHYVTPSNAISAVRVVLTVPACYAVFSRYYGLAAAICFLAYLTDILDGYLARKLNDVSEVGKIIDPIADKLYVAGVVVAMVLQGLIPIGFMIAILMRDALILAVGVWATKRFSVVLPSNYPGKAAALTIAMTLFLALLGVSPDVLVFMEFLSIALMLVSLGVYFRRLVNLLRQTTPDPA